MTLHPLPVRRGITLLEVIISIGILAVGLTSVVSLVPAGQSQAARAVILDRAAAAVANGLHDAVTYGLTKPDAVAFDVATPGPVWIFDPVVQRAAVTDPLVRVATLYPSPAGVPPAVGASLKPSGVYSQASSPANPSWQITNLVGQGRDDILVTAGAGPDDAPLNAFDSNGLRLFNGRMTCLFSVARADNALTTSPLAGDVAKLTVVAFHNRDLVTPAAGFVDFEFDDVQSSLSLSKGASLPSGRSLREVIRPGVVIYDGKKGGAANLYQRWSQIQMASVDASDGTVFVTFSSPTPTGGTVRVLLDSVGMAEQMVILEGPGPYSK